MERRITVLVSIILLLSVAKLSLPYAQEISLSSPPNKSDANVCIRNKDYPCVINYLNSIIKNDTKCLECYFGLGILNYYLGNYQESISFLERTIERSYIVKDNNGHNRVLAFIALGIIYNKINQHGKAEEALGKAIEHCENLQDRKTVFFVEAMLEMVKQHNSDTDTIKNLNQIKK